MNRDAYAGIALLGAIILLTGPHGSGLVGIVAILGANYLTWSDAAFSKMSPPITPDLPDERK